MRTIAHFILSMTIGGGEHLVRTLSQRIHIQHYRNHVICFDKIDNFQNEFKAANVEIDLILRRKMLFDPKVIPPLITLIKKKNIQLIHAHDLSSLLYAITAGIFCNVDIIMTEHSRHYIDEFLRRRIEKWFLSLFVKKWVVVSPELKSSSINIDHLRESKIKVIENGVDFNRFISASSSQLRQELNIRENDLLILSVGRLETIKGQQHLVSALQLQCLNHANITIIFVGDGSNRKQLEIMVNESGLGQRVHFLGSRKDVPDIMASCDLFVLPSESEGLPFALLEAIASGLPVIATAVGRIPALLNNGLLGKIVPPCNPKALADGINELVANINKANEMARMASIMLNKKYSIERMLNEYRSLYMDILK